MDFETVLLCILIPTAYILAYIAGKNDLLGMIGRMIEETVKELAERKQIRENDKYPFLRDNRPLLDKAYEQGYLSGFDFSVLMQGFLISKYGWVIDTGNYENVNAEVALRLERKIKEHPDLWRFFMVA